MPRNENSTQIYKISWAMMRKLGDCLLASLQSLNGTKSRQSIHINHIHKLKVIFCMNTSEEECVYFGRTIKRCVHLIRHACTTYMTTVLFTNVSSTESTKNSTEFYMGDKIRNKAIFKPKLQNFFKNYQSLTF